MNPVQNPFAPGAGSQPPELAGRDSIISDADIVFWPEKTADHKFLQD
mgnify:CR=1 FL=1